jgi:uncharacterized protein YjiS (DUF1127 family)
MALLIWLPRNGSQEPNASLEPKMPNIMVHGWAQALIRGSGGYTLHKQEDSSSWLHGLLTNARLWTLRSQQRRALGELVERDDRMLRDIGVSREAAQREAAKPFWQG